MKKIIVILFVVLSVGFAGFSEAATPKKRTRNANRIGPYAGAIVGYSEFSGNQDENEQNLIDILTNTGNPFQSMSSSTENTDVGYQALFGYRFHRYFAAELGLAQFGDLTSTAKTDISATVLASCRPASRLRSRRAAPSSPRSASSRSAKNLNSMADWATCSRVPNAR
jgi:hypothetical protein